MTTSSNFHIYPAQFGNEVWCIYSDFLDIDFMSNSPRAAMQIYPTFCNCCLKNVCHFQLRIDCDALAAATSGGAGTATATTGVMNAMTTMAATTATTETTSTTATAVLPVQASSSTTPAYYALRICGGYVSLTTAKTMTSATTTSETTTAETVTAATTAAATTTVEMTIASTTAAEMTTTAKKTWQTCT